MSKISGSTERQHDPAHKMRRGHELSVKGLGGRQRTACWVTMAERERRQAVQRTEEDNAWKSTKMPLRVSCDIGGLHTGKLGLLQEFVCAEKRNWPLLSSPSFEPHRLPWKFRLPQAMPKPGVMAGHNCNRILEKGRLQSTASHELKNHLLQ